MRSLEKSLHCCAIRLLQSGLALLFNLVILGMPHAAEAQQTGTVWRIGVLMPERSGVLDALVEGLRGLNYVEGRNIILEYRRAARDDELPKLAAELVRLNPHVIVAATGRAALALKATTKTVPIVMATSGDAVGQGLVASLARPGGNVTGMTVISPDLVANDCSILPLPEPVTGLANKARVPALYPFPRYVQADGLMSYGPNSEEQWRRAAVFVDKILRSAKPAELPVEQPTKFELIINLKVAKDLGLTIPPSLLVRADKVIE